jgi:ABC-type transport system substrate-binding protein
MSARRIHALALAALLLLAACVSLPATENPPTPTAAPTVPTAVPATRPVPIDPARPHADARVRGVLAHCTDRAALLRGLYPWIEDAAAYTAGVPPAASAETARLAALPYDPAQGRALLPDARLALTVTTTTSSDRRAWLETWAGQLAACGIALKIDARPPEWFYGERTGLAAGDYQLAAFSRRADDGGGHAAAELPLFHRADVFATHPQLENFAPPADGIHTRNAAEWRIPGRDTIVIGEDAEPAEPLASEQAYVAKVVHALIEGDAPGAPGPYRIVEWTHGSRMVLERNPEYAGPAPATPRILIRFLPHDAVIHALLKGQVDVLDWESLTPRDVVQFGLDRAAAAGTIRLLTRPAAMWEVVRFGG